MSGPENNPRDDEPVDREEYEAWEATRGTEVDTVIGDMPLEENLEDRKPLSLEEWERDPAEEGASLIQDLAPHLESVPICLKKNWKPGERVRVTVERVRKERK